jgi:anti-sigma factor RsiW
MSRRRLEKQIGAFRDGGLPERHAEQLRRRLDVDPEARTELARHEALGKLMRKAWRDGPPAPPAERLIARLRPEMVRIDRELERTLPVRWRGWLTPAPLLALGAAAAVLALAIVRSPEPPAPAAARTSSFSVPFAAAGSAALVSQPLAARSQEAEIPVYDLAQGNAPLMLFEDQGTTFIWLIQPEKTGDDLSALPGGWA